MVVDQPSARALIAVFAALLPSASSPVRSSVEPTVERVGDEEKIPAGGGQLALEHAGEAVAPMLFDCVDLAQRLQLGAQRGLGG